MKQNNMWSGICVDRKQDQSWTERRAKTRRGRECDICIGMWRDRSADEGEVEELYGEECDFY